MGESKRPIYAYIDETGNTGGNIFDENQPDFFTASLIVKGDFDSMYSGRVQAIARQVGAEALHAKEMKELKVEAAAPAILQLGELQQRGRWCCSRDECCLAEFSKARCARAVRSLEGTASGQPILVGRSTQCEVVLGRQPGARSFSHNAWEKVASASAEVG